VRIDGWQNAAAARQEILDCVARYDAAADKPHF
jgi:inorganic pyrophosphatase